jgi:hypothetical protein
MSGLSGIGIFWAFATLLAALGSSVGFYMPFWLHGRMGDAPVYFGLFRICNTEIDINYLREREREREVKFE